MKILVTGGAGFIASHVTDAYLKAGHQVIVLDNFSSGRWENLGIQRPAAVESLQPGQTYTHEISPQLTVIAADITDRENIKEIIAQHQPEVLNLHAAHIQVGHSVEDPQFDATNNILGMLNILEAAKTLPQGHLKKVIFASTGGAMYGEQPTPFVETMKEQPLSPYGISKRSGELYLHFYNYVHHFNYTVLRYANVYGERQNPHGESGVIAIFMEQLANGKIPFINGDGSHTRDYVYVGDVARANVLALETPFIGALNIGTGREISTLQVFEAATKALGIDAKPEFRAERPGEQVTSSLNPAKAKQILGWEPTVKFEEGVKKVGEWYKAGQPHLQLADT